MLFESANQSIIFLTMMSFGFFAGIIDAIPHWITTKIKKKSILFMVDVFRPIVFAIIFFIGICLCNYGEIRLFTIVGALLGFWIEKKFFQKYVSIFCVFIFSKIKKVYQFLIKNKNQKEKESKKNPLIN